MDRLVRYDRYMRLKTKATHIDRIFTLAVYAPVNGRFTAFFAIEFYAISSRIIDVRLAGAAFFER